MIPRYSASLLAFCFMGVFTVVAPSSAAAEGPTLGAQQWVMPRTPDGHPDLQGNWTNETVTPFEREEGQGPVFTREEVEKIEQGEASRFLEGQQPSDVDRPAPPAGGNVGAYNNVYFDRGQRVAIVNGEPRTSLVTSPPSGRRAPLTPEGERRIKEYEDFRDQFGLYDHPELRPFAERCILFGSPSGPPMIPVGAYNSNYTIVQTADHVMIMSEMVHDVRIIPIGEPQTMRKDVRPWFGNSWGRWEGDVLVVETTNISPQQPVRGIPLSEEAVVTERFTRVDEETIVYEFTVDDPTMFTEPWGGEIPINRFHANLYEYACHEGNYALANVLSGARYQERQAGRN